MSGSRLGQLGRALKAPFVAVAVAYNDTARTHPVTTGIVTTVIKTSLADLMAQKVVEGRKEMDWARHGMFCTFGFAYLGCWQYYLYNRLFIAWCRPITAAVGHIGSVPVKVFIDQCIHHPFMYFPVFYSLKGIVEGRSWEDSFAKYQRELWQNCKALWTIWVPAQFINFSLVPAHLRIPFVALVSFAWTVVISVMRGGMDKDARPCADDGRQHVATMESIELGHIAGKRIEVACEASEVAQAAQAALTETQAVLTETTAVLADRRA